MKQLIAIILYVFLAVLSLPESVAQPGFDDESADQPADLPIDKDVMWVVVGTALYGIVLLTKRKLPINFDEDFKNKA